MRLAKPHLDLGLYCGGIEASRAFYEGRVGLAYEELLKVGGGLHQHRLGLRGAVLKLNSSREPLAAGRPSCLRGFAIASQVDDVVELVDPDGIVVTLVPPGFDRNETVGVRWATTDVDRLGRLLAEGFDAVAVDDDRWRVGTTLLALEPDPAAAHAPERALGFRYLTVQVHDVVAEHARLLEVGWTEERAPVRLGDVAAISFVQDPDGVSIEISQRASLTGSLDSFDGPTAPGLSK